MPYFLLGGTALGLARGDEVYPLRRQVRAHVVVVDPGIHVSTARVFARVDARLTPRENSNSIFYFVSRELEGSGAFRLLVNDLEEAALEEAPALREQAGAFGPSSWGGRVSRGPLGERRELLRAVRGRAPARAGARGARGARASGPSSRGR